MADWSKPTVASAYVDYTAELVARDLSLATQFDSATINDSNIPTGTKRWNSANNNWEKYASGTWTPLTSVYNISISGSAGSAPWIGISDKPTTISGFGITNAYTKSEVDSQVSLKANIASPTFTGTPAAPTPNINENSTKLATTEFVKNQGYLTVDSAHVGPTTILNASSMRYFWNSVILSDGTLKEWGYNGQGQLSEGYLNTTSPQVKPTDAIFHSSTINNEIISKVITGSSGSFILTQSGKVYANGSGGTSGVFGIAGTAATGAFQSLSTFETNNITITDVAYSSSYLSITGWGINYQRALFLASNGSVYTTGLNTKGNTTTEVNYSTPTYTEGLPPVDRIYTGGEAAMSGCFAWNSNSTSLWSWGRNYTGSLGHNSGTAGNRVVQEITVFPSPVVKILSEGGPTQVVDSSTYACTTYALLANGEVWACGYNAGGQIGDGTTTQSNVFKRCGTLTGITDIATSGGMYANVLALKGSTGEVWAWGRVAKRFTQGIDGILTTPTLLSGTYKFINGSSGSFGTTCAFFLISTDNSLKFLGYNSGYCSGSIGVPVNTWANGVTVSQLPKLLDGEYPIEATFPHLYYNSSASSTSYANGMLLTNKRRLFMVGTNTNGELGVGTTLTKRVWTEVKF